MEFKQTHLLLLGSFFLALLLGMFIGTQFISQQLSIVDDSSDLGNVGYFFLYILFATAVMLLILHFYQGKKLFFFAELLLEFSAIQILLSIFIAELYSNIVGLALVVARYFKPWLKQPLLFLATIVVGALLGSSFDLIPALILSFLLAAYDYFAVFKSKHMVTLAKELQKREAAFAIEFTTKSPTPATSSSKKQKKIPEKENRGDSILLGTGDFVVPVMLCVAVLKLSVASALMTALGAFVGLSALLFVMQKTRGYYPALPPIVLFSTLFYVASLLF